MVRPPLQLPQEVLPSLQRRWELLHVRGVTEEQDTYGSTWENHILFEVAMRTL